MPDHLHIFVAGMQGETSLLHGMVDCRTEVVERVEQGAVQIEYHQFVLHDFTISRKNTKIPLNPVETVFFLLLSPVKQDH